MRVRVFRHKATGEIRLWATEQEVGTQHLAPDRDGLLEELGFARLPLVDGDGTELPEEAR